MNTKEVRYGVDGCKCSMSISMLGDGCRHCQPQEYIDRFSEMLDEERDQQAQRIGELEGLLLRVQVSLSLDDTEWGYSGAEKYKLLADIRAALSAGKEVS